MEAKKEIINKLKECLETDAGIMGINKVILFGSYAKGTNTKDSDIDLLVIGSEKERSLRTKIAVMFHKAIPEKPMDVLLKTDEEINKRLSMGDSFIKSIIEKGVIVYERDSKRVAG